MGGGAWPFLVGGAICLVNSDNERDSSLLNRWRVLLKNLGSGFVGTRVSVSGVLCPPVVAAGRRVRGEAFRRRVSFLVVCGGGRWLGSSGAGAPRRFAPFSRPSQLFLEGQAASSRVTVSNNRSVMPLDVLGRTRATLKESACFYPPVRKDRVTAEPPSWLGLGTAMIPMNQESLVGASH